MHTIKVFSVIATVSLMFVSTPSVAASLKDAKPAFKSGDWTVLRSINTMTDKPSCTGIYKQNYGIQLTRDSLYVKVSGGVQGVQLRIGENPPKPKRLAEEIEKKIGAVIIDGTDFEELLDSSKLRIEVYTLLKHVVDEDINLTGIKAALENIRSGCPLQPQPPSASAPKKIASESLCSDELISRMKANGLKESQIKKICYK